MNRQDDRTNGISIRPAETVQEDGHTRYRTLFDLAPIAVYSCDSTGVVQEYNQRAAELWGRAPAPGDTDERFCGSFKLYRPDGNYMPHAHCPMNDVLSGKVSGVHDAEVHIERPDGSRVIVIVNIAPVTNLHGTITGAINCFYDVTERHQAEGARFRLAAIVESSDDAIISKDLNGLITSWNGGAQRLFGYTAYEAIGQPISMLRPTGRPDDEPGVLEHTRHGKLIDRYDTVRRHKDGTGLNISWTVSPIRDGHDQVVGASKIGRDITERQRADERLRKSEARYRHLYESIDEGFCIIQMVFDANLVPLDYVFLEVNPAFEKQTGMVNAQGQSMRGIARHHETHWFEMFGRVALTGESTRFEYPAAEFHRWYEGYAYRVGEASEGNVAILWSDITERKRTEARLRQVNEELEARVAERTVELTHSETRLRALVAELNVTEQRERQRLAADLHDYLGQLLALNQIKLGQAKKLPLPPSATKLVDEMHVATTQALTYTRTLISHLTPPVLKEFGLPMALKWLTEQMQERALTVSLHVKTTTLALPEDHALLLFQSIRELLMNCVKHARVGEATVILDVVDDLLSIDVADRGTGFDTRASAKITQAPKSGYGLFSIRERMLSLGGGFELESLPGYGTTARLVLPLAGTIAPAPIVGHGSLKETGDSHEHTGLPAPERPNSSKVRVLVADDHAMVRQGLCGLLKQYSDIQVVGEAPNGAEAVALANRLQPDVILMDVTMPKMDGLEATRLVKRAHPTVIVIGLSVHTTGPVVTALLEAGASAFINKEAAVEELYQTIQIARKKEKRQSLNTAEGAYSK